MRADRLDTVNYNFKLAGGGGGSSAVLDSSQNLEIYCNDFNNVIYVPQTNYSATLSGITFSTFNAGSTRFGNMSSSGFLAVTISDGDANDATYAGVINNAGAFARYEMAAYLVSQYNLAGGSNTYNNGLQMAIWKMLDPTVYGDAATVVATGANPTEGLEMAAQWYSGTSLAQRDAYLAQFRIISDSTMTAGGTNGPRIGGFQEQITRLPEPASYPLLAFAMLGLGLLRARKQPRGV